MAHSKRRKRSSYIVGEKGVNRVRLFAQDRDGILYVEYRDESQVKRRQCLKHGDWDRGKKAAESLAAALREHDTVRRHEGLTLQSLFDRYERLELVKKSPAVQAHRRRTRVLFERCWGAQTKASALGKNHWNKFIEERGSGVLCPPGRDRKDHPKQSPRAKPAGERQVQYDLSFLRAVLNWAMSEKDENGKRLLDANPFHGLRLHAKTTPKRPLVNDAEYSRLKSAAVEIGSGVALFLVLAHETGHRASAIRQLRWSDFNAETKTLRWRAESDKLKFDHTVPLSEAAVAALSAAQRECGRIGEAWIFPDETQLAKSIKRQAVLHWWRKLEARSGIPRIEGRGWHSFRRKFATELKRVHGGPSPDIARMGGWKGTRVLMDVYMQPDEETMRELLTKRSELHSSAI